MAADKLEINVHDHLDGWITATVENFDGDELGRSTAPVTEGATFDVRAAAIRDAVEQALRAGAAE